MSAEDIFLGSQASLTMIPEVDLYIPLDHSHSTGSGDNAANTNTVKVNTSWANHFLMVNNLYVGCIVELYANAAQTTVISTHTITSNTDNDITLSPDPRTIISGDFIFLWK